MEDGNFLIKNDEKIVPNTLAGFYDKREKLTTNGHDFHSVERSKQLNDSHSYYPPALDTYQDEKTNRRLNPLRIRLGKRSVIDDTLQYSSTSKRMKLTPNTYNDPSKSQISRVPKFIPMRVDKSQFHHVGQQSQKVIDNERDKPVPRLVPKSQLHQYKQNKKGQNTKQYKQNIRSQPMVKFKCRKCCSISFNTLAMLKAHQLVCRAQTKEPIIRPEEYSLLEMLPGGPSRVTKNVFFCSSCGTYYENWDLFLHMREIHSRYLCLFCLGMFPKAEKLSTHLTSKHNIQEFACSNKEEFCSGYSGKLFLMCCVCEEIYCENDDFFNHDCNNVKPKPVPVLVSKNAVKKKANNCTHENSSVLGLENKTFNNVEKDVQKEEKDSISQPSVVKDVINETKSVILNNISLRDTNSITETTLPEVEKYIPSTKENNVIDSGYDMSDSNDNKLTNSEKCVEQSNGTYSPHSNELPVDREVQFENKSITIEKDREVGIKLKLSLNKANSPIIINSTVDPSVGQNSYKPPLRTRRPPKRYEKEPSLEPQSITKMPSIKMTICDNANSPFVKTTVYENYEHNETLSPVNNNMDAFIKKSENKSENTVKSTIYDNNLDGTDTLNRVPKLTVKLPKELLDKDSSSDCSSDSDVNDHLTVDESSIPEAQSDNFNKELLIDVEGSMTTSTNVVQHDLHIEQNLSTEVSNTEKLDKGSENEMKVIDTDIKMEPKIEVIDNVNMKGNFDDTSQIVDEVPAVEIMLDKPLDKYTLKELLRLFLSSTIHNCIYCNHVRKIAVNGEQLSIHMAAQHRFSATVNSITAEELMPGTIASKVAARADELQSVYLNLDYYDSIDKSEQVQFDHLFECFQCYFKTPIHKDLYSHNRKMHQKTILLCVMCKSNFYSYSELLCHLCPGTYDSEFEIRFRCCLCNVDTIPSSFRLMVHLRKVHNTCDVCLEFCHSQIRLSNHVWKHKLHHLCYRCGIAYRNKPDITKHLFWKHGTESVMCKKCLQKKWPHVYHFCTPPAIFTCEECSLQFTKAVYLKVHKRFHSGQYPHVCTEVDCTEKFVSKKLLNKHLEEHRKKLFIQDLCEVKPIDLAQQSVEASAETPVIDILDDSVSTESKINTVNNDTEKEPLPGKSKKKKCKDKDTLLLDVNLPELNLSESDSSDESDNGIKEPVNSTGEISKQDQFQQSFKEIDGLSGSKSSDFMYPSELSKEVDSSDHTKNENENKTDEQKVLDIWDNFKKYQEKVEQQEPKAKTPPLVPIRKHVCESDHDYCIVPTDLNGGDDLFDVDKKKNKKSPKKKHSGLSSSSSSSSSDSDSSCSCGSNCSCSSSSGSSSSSSSGSDTSVESGTENKKNKKPRKSNTRRLSNGSNVDVMGTPDTPILVPEKSEPLVAESDLETNESETDEEFYDEHPQQLANKFYAEKRNQLMLLASVVPSEAGSLSGDLSRSTTPVKEIKEEKKLETEENKSSNKKKSKKKKKKSSRKEGSIKINIPKDIITRPEILLPFVPTAPNKITISLQSNNTQFIVTPPPALESNISVTSSMESKRMSKRRRVPNKFYGYSSDEETAQPAALKPQQPPKLEWRKEDLPSPVTPKPKKELPSISVPKRLFSHKDSIRLTVPRPEPELPRILMNSESMDSSDSDSSDDNGLEIYQPNCSQSTPVQPPSYLNSGTSSLPYSFKRPNVREAREGESVYCYCRCPYDEVSEMIGCDAEGCPIEWFHFECVGIMVPPKGKWYCPECSRNQNFSGYR